MSSLSVRVLWLWGRRCWSGDSEAQSFSMSWTHTLPWCMHQGPSCSEVSQVSLWLVFPDQTAGWGGLNPPVGLSAALVTAGVAVACGEGKAVTCGLGPTQFQRRLSPTASVTVGVTGCTVHTCRYSRALCSPVQIHDACTVVGKLTGHGWLGS